MSARATLSTASRVLRQLRHDKRTVGLLVVVPAVLIALVWAMYDGDHDRFNQVGLALLGLFPFITMFLVTSVSMLRERTTGTLERFMTLPPGKTDLLFGYGLAFSAAALVQSTVATATACGPLGLDTGSPVLAALVSVASAVLGVALGLLCSAFARTEFQAVQFMPVVVLPQMLLCGLFVPRDDMAGWLESVSNISPLTYAVKALRELSNHGGATGSMWADLAYVICFAAAALVAASTTLRRRTG
jgi:ABC-2 type transport system permease protein